MYSRIISDFFSNGMLVSSGNEKEHLKQLEIVPTLMRKHQLKAKGTTGSFLQLRTEYLGHIISGNWLKIDPQKIEAMLN